ncbi:MAG: hypothetical protein Q8O72_02195 [Bacteroidales bacterium]|jgi:hypothetical protein|nr:hypothetical protein [Bacteroidales bacterium]
MDSQTNQLLEKYWRAETSPEEEKELKILMASDTESSACSHYFKAVSELKQQEPEFGFLNPGKRIRMMWYTVAASVTIGILVVSGLFQYNYTNAEYNVNDPDKAFEITRQALMMVSNGLNEGKNYTSVQLQEFNKPKELLSGNNNK